MKISRTKTIFTEKYEIEITLRELEKLEDKYGRMPFYDIPSRAVYKSISDNI